MKNSNGEKKEELQWVHFLRQILIASGAWCLYFSIGIVFGATTVYIPQLRKTAATTGALSDEMASWLASTVFYVTIPWIFVLPFLARTIGRRKTSIFSAIGNIVGFSVFACSSTPTHLLITEAIFALTHATTLTVTILIIAEYTSPKYRGILLCIKSATLTWGIWVSNAIGTYAHWWYISLCGLIVSLYGITVLFWPESPHWLASKKRFTECRSAHRWLKGAGENAEMELESLIKSQSTEVERISYLEAIKSRELYMPLVLCLLIILQYHLSGKFVITIYAIDILKKMISDESKVYRSMLILDGVTVFSTYVGCYLTKLSKRRTILFITTSVAISFLLVLSVYMYLIKYSIVSENVYVSICFLSGFSLSIGCGPVILSTSLYGELIPTRFKSFTLTVVALSFTSLHGILVRVSPLIFKSFGLGGAFLFYGLCSSVCLLFLFLYLPETKDKTLLEIEDYFKSGGFKEENIRLVMVK